MRRDPRENPGRDTTLRQEGVVCGGRDVRGSSGLEQGPRTDNGS